jgi:hypothetical protein
MVIKINAITEALASFQGRAVGSVAQALVNNAWTPSVLSIPIAEWIGYWHDSAPVVPNNPPFLSFLTDRLREVGWECPEAFFEEPQVRCPATGEPLTVVAYNESFRFKMDEDYVVAHNGGCILHGDGQWFSEDYRMHSYRSGWFHTDDCSHVEDCIYPDWYISRNAVVCSVCQTYVWRGNEDLHERCPLCSTSAVAAQYLGGLAPTSFRLLDYDDCSSTRLPGQSRKTDRYGIELEVLVKDIGEVGTLRTRQSVVATHAYHALKCFPDNYAVAKRDGSLYNCGFELVTKPDTYDKMHKTLGEALFKFSPLLTNTGTCEGVEIEAGLHINMERRGKSVFHQAKMLYFMFSLGNRDFVTAVAGRYCETYAKFPERARWSDIFQSPFEGRRQKYIAVYVKEKVLEFRLFRSSIGPAFVLSCLEFCEALTHFTKYASAQSLTYDEFISFVLATNKFPHLTDRLRSSALQPFLQNKTTK